MFTQTWKKYLPVIAILMKRSSNGEQTLNMNHSDFARAAGGRKLKFSFSLLLNNGRMDNSVKYTPIVKEFAQVLQDHDLTRSLTRNQQFEFAMNNEFQLLIKNNTPPPPPTRDGLPAESDETANTEPAEITGDTKVS